MNAKHTDWNQTTLQNIIGEKLFDYISLNNLLLLNNQYCYKKPTMVTSGFTIDLAITNDGSMISEMKIIYDQMISDHYPIQIKFLSQQQQLFQLSIPKPVCNEHVKLNAKPKITADMNLTAQEIKELTDKKWEPFTEQLQIILNPLLSKWNGLYLPIIENHQSLLAEQIKTPTELITQQEIDVIWQELKELILLLSDVTIGNKKINNRSKHWFNDRRVLDSLKHLRKCKRHYFNDRSNMEKKQQLYLAKQQWYSIVHETSVNNFKQFCSTLNNNKKIYWNTWNRSKPSSFTPLNSICNLQTNALPTSMEQSLDNLCEYFASVSTMTSENSLSDEVKEQVNEFIQTPVSTSEILEDEGLIQLKTIIKYCNTIPTDTALGPDKVSPYHIKYGGKHLHECLYILFNLCWISGILPTEFTSANIFALHKSGNKTTPGNFRPISLTSIVIRMYERIIYPKIMCVITRSNKLNKYQFGFRTNRSTYDNLYIVISNIYEALHNKKHKSSQAKLPIIYLDLKKAFDSINIDATLYKLSTFGIKGRLYLFFNSFLRNRRIRTMYQNDFSSWHSINMGTPQGSVIGPLIFLVYINDLLDEIQSTNKVIPSAFADDIALVPINYVNNDYNCTFQELIITMQQSLSICSNWAVKWGMSFSSEKSNLVVYRNRKKISIVDQQLIDSLTLSNFQIITKSTYKYLGVDLDEIGTSLFHTHIQRIFSKANKIAHLVTRLIQNDIPIHIGRLLTNATVRAVCSYALPMIRLTKQQISKLESTIATPLKRTLGLPRHASNRAVLFECTVPTIPIMREYLLLRAANRYFELPDSHCAKQLFYKDYHYHQSVSYSRADRPRISNYRSIGFEVIELEDINAVPMLYSHLANKLSWHPVNHTTTTKTELYQKMKQLCEHEWNNIETKCQSLRTIKHEFTTEKYQSIDPPEASKIRARLRLNVAKNNDSLFKRKLIEQNQCNYSHCSSTSEIETREHVLLHCPRYQQLRNDMQLQLQMINIHTISIELLLGLNYMKLSECTFVETLCITTSFLSKIQSIRLF
jgi:hypothetical protein